MNLIRSLGLERLGCHTDGHLQLIAGGATDPYQPALCASCTFTPETSAPYSGSQVIHRHLDLCRGASRAPQPEALSVWT